MELSSLKPPEPDRYRRIRQALGEWYDTNKRDLPWRRTRDPYRIWISEVMLQQTRVAAVIPYYERFLARFPTVEALAEASENDLLSAWAGLGYYSRARNLQRSAKEIVALGSFPNTYEGLRALPGIGDYTASAISSISFGVPQAVLDGNVLRVLARLNGDAGDIRSGAVRTRMREEAQELLDTNQPERHNQAIMELGALICVPINPTCEGCPVEKMCIARSQGLERKLPTIIRKGIIRRSRRTLLVSVRNEQLLLGQRSPSAALLAGFWELPELNQLPVFATGPTLHTFQHTITNNIYDIHVVEASFQRTPPEFQWIPLDKIWELPLSTATRKALTKVFEKTSAK